MMNKNIGKEGGLLRANQVSQIIYTTDEADIKPAPTLTSGVEKIERVTSLWSPATIILFWAGMVLLAIAMSLDAQTVSSYQPYALSEFGAHSMLSAVSTLQNILNAATKPVMAKVADASGRAEAISASLAAILLGFIINATSHSLSQLAVGQIFYSIGQNGVLFIQQILAADTTTLENRTIFSSMLYAPAIFTAWAGAPMVSALVPLNWRWGYAMWTIIIPFVATPLLSSLFWQQRRAKVVYEGQKRKSLRSIGSEADIVGLFLFLSGFVLILLPMTINTRFHGQWSSPQSIAMIVIGIICFVSFVLYELYIPKFPILSLRLAKSRTVAAGCLTGGLFFLSISLWQPYFYSFLVVVNGMSAKAATNVTICSGVSTAVTGMATSFVVKKTGNCKWVIVSGAVVKLIGGGLMILYSNEQASMVQIVFAQLILAAGSGMISVVAQTAVQAVAEHQDLANVTTLYEASRSIGSAVGSAIGGAIWTHLLIVKLRRHLPGSAQPKAVAIQNSFTLALSFPIGSAERHAVNQSYTDVLRILLIAAEGFLALTLLTTLVIENMNLKNLDKGMNHSSIFKNIDIRQWFKGKR